MSTDCTRCQQPMTHLGDTHQSLDIVLQHAGKPYNRVIRQRWQCTGCRQVRVELIRRYRKPKSGQARS